MDDKDDIIQLRNEQATATVHRYAAHVTHFDVDGKKVLFLSKEAVFQPPKAIRGGIPIIWPQFSNRGELPAHGFARNSFWTVVEQQRDSVTLQLEDTEETRKVYPPFRLLYTVELQPRALRIKFRVEAKGDADLSFTFALHSYFQVDHISQVRVEGLNGCKYQNHLKDMAVEEEARDIITIAEETDRTYLRVPRELRIATGTESGVLLRTSANLADAVLWNPWIDKSKRMGDFGDDEYLQMVCLEVGNVKEPVVVGKGSSWEATHEIVSSAPSKL